MEGNHERMRKGKRERIVWSVDLRIQSRDSECLLYSISFLSVEGHCEGTGS